MTNPNSVNIAEERRTKELSNKFQVKGAHERDITPISRLVYVLLHIASALGAIGSLFYMKFDSQLEKFLYFIVFGALALLNEVLKGRKMEYFTTVKIISNDADKPMEEREKAHDETMKAMLPVLAFWVLSVCAVGYTGYSFGESKVNYRFTAENYDDMLKKTAENAIAGVQNGAKLGYSARKMQELTATQNAAVEVWKTHKDRVDNDNRRNKAVNEDEAMVMGLIYILIGIGLEVLLFVARLWHEKEQYEVLKSKLKAQKTGKNSKETDGNSEKQDGNSKKQKETAKTTDVTINQNDLDAILSEIKSLRTQKSLLEEVVNSKK